MNIHLPETLSRLIEIFKFNNFKCYVVGGAIRDLILGVIPHEFDICTSALTSDIKSLFGIFKDERKEFGSIKIFFEDTWFEVTTLRVERNYIDFRHPSSIYFTNDYTLDALRRDFTINSIYTDGIKILDPLNGIYDINKKILRLIGDKNLKFSEDPLRILRCLKFKSRFNFKIEFETLIALKNNFHLIRHLSSYRLHLELVEIFKNKYSYDCIKIFNTLNGFQIIFKFNFEVFEFSKILNLPNKFHIKIFCILYFHSNIKKHLIPSLLTENLSFSRSELYEINLIMKLLEGDFNQGETLFIKGLILNYGYDTSLTILSVISIYIPKFKDTLHKFFKIKWGYSPVKISHMKITLGKILKDKKNITKYNKYLVTVLHLNPHLNNKKTLLHLLKNKFKL